MKLGIDLKDIDNRLIVKRGRVLGPQLVRECQKKGVGFQKKMMLRKPPVFLADLKKVLQEPLYEKVFDSPSVREKILKQAAQMPIQAALFREILKLRRSSNHTYRHFLLIASFSARMAMDLTMYGFNPRLAFLFGLVHDLGKARLPPALLNKKKRLTRDEYKILRGYPVKSLLLLHYYLGPKQREACRVAYEHHETLDGAGYPKGIKNLSKYTRIIAVADVFDALVAPRPYRKRQFTVRGALDKLIHGMNAGKFPKLPVRLLISYFRTGNPNFRTLKISRMPRDPDPAGNSYGKFAR